LEGWAKIKGSSEYAGVSPRTLRRWFKMGLEHSRMPGGTILINKNSIDQFLKQYTVSENEAEQLANQVMGEFSN
jgi:predicted site-specific integrase-resolvase